MRQHLVLVMVAVPALGGLARADSAPTQIDIKPVAARLDVWRDDTGKYYVIPKASKTRNDDVSAYTFHGDGKTLYQQRVNSSSNLEVFSIQTWAPRVRGLTFGMLEVAKNGTASVVCSQGEDGKIDRKALTLASADDAKRVLATAKFLSPLWRHQIAFFGRDDTGKYYLVDMLREEYGRGGHRLFIGKKGQLKRVTITDTAEDTGGTVIMTKVSELEIPPAGASATLRTGRKSITIQNVDPYSNRYLIYRELGVYGQLGTICEDQ